MLAPAIKYFVSPQLSAGATSLVTGAIFAATHVGRPVGALIFGPFADRVGRKRMTLISIGGALGPETRDVDMGATRKDDREREPRFTREPVGEAAAAEPARSR